MLSKDSASTPQNLIRFGVFQLHLYVDKFPPRKFRVLVDLASTAEQAAEVSKGEIVDVDELAEHVEILDDLGRLHGLEPPHVLCSLPRVLVPVGQHRDQDIHQNNEREADVESIDGEQQTHAGLNVL